LTQVVLFSGDADRRGALQRERFGALGYELAAEDQEGGKRRDSDFVHGILPSTVELAPPVSILEPAHEQHLSGAFSFSLPDFRAPRTRKPIHKGLIWPERAGSAPRRDGIDGLIVNLLLVVPAPAHRARQAGAPLRTPKSIEKE
jgi:hypothetical protein